MIRLYRDRMPRKVGNKTAYVVPGGLHGRYLRDKNLKLLKLKRQLGTLASTGFAKSAWKPAKDQLRAETHNKCAYCEASTKVVAHGDVEHFRPKSHYWWLAYCYDNYLYSCQICNEIYKSDNFPVSGARMAGPDVGANTTDEALEALKSTLCPDPIVVDRGYTQTQFGADCAAEEADLIDPYALDPATLMAWEADAVLREVSLVPVSGDARSAVVVKALVDYCGLNREELRSLRWVWYRILADLRDDIQGGALATQRIAAKKELVREMTSAEAPFAGMARYFVETWQLDVAP